MNWSPKLDKEEPLLDYLTNYISTERCARQPFLEYDSLKMTPPFDFSRTKEPEKEKEKKQDMALNSTIEAEKKEEPSPSVQSEP